VRRERVCEINDRRIAHDCDGSNYRTSCFLSLSPLSSLLTPMPSPHDADQETTPLIRTDSAGSTPQERPSFLSYLHDNSFLGFGAVFAQVGILLSHVVLWKVVKENPSGQCPRKLRSRDIQELRIAGSNRSVYLPPSVPICSCVAFHRG